MVQEFREKIEKEILAKREKLSPNSVKTYVSILFNLHKKLAKENDDDLDWFNHNEKEIFENLKEKTSQTRKSILSALYILTGKEEYKTQMLADCKLVNDNYKNQKMDTKQKENWVDVDEIHKIYDDLRIEVKQIFASKKVMNYETIMSFFLVALLGGINGLAPRRSLDYGLMKVKNYNTDTDNYYRGGKFYFNVYKTADKYGLQVIDCPTELNTLIKRWIKINTDNDYLLFIKNGNHLSSIQITRIFNIVF